MVCVACSMATPAFALIAATPLLKTARARASRACRHSAPSDQRDSRPVHSGSFRGARMELKTLTPSQAKVLSLKSPGAKDRMKLYDLTGTGMIFPAEFNEWVDNAVSRVTARSTG